MKNFSLLRTPCRRFLPCFLFVFALLYVSLAGLRILACTSTIDFLKHSTFVVVSSLLITLTLLIWHFHKKLILSYALFVFLYAGVILIKMYDHSTLLDREIVQTICFALIVCGLIFIFSYISHMLSFPILVYGFRASAMILAFLSLLYPLIVFSFFFTSGGHMLSHDVILTLFQTNFSEIRAFLVDQNVYMFAFVFVFLLALTIKLMQLIRQTISVLPPPTIFRIL